jgi:uncharacterized phage protein (TIGR01671 family)
LNGWGESRVFIDLQGKIYTESWPAEDGDEYSLDEDFQDLIPMQYTGLKDSRGRKIFESDIVRICLLRHPHGVDCIVTWREEYAGFSFIKVHKGQALHENPSDGWSMSLSDGFEVIGNVYENPELLKV